MFITSKANILADGRRGQQTTKRTWELSLQQVEKNNATWNGWTRSCYLVCNYHSKAIGVIP